MPIYEYRCDNCLSKFEEIESFEESERFHVCPICGDFTAKKIPSVPRYRMDRIYDNAERGVRAFFGEEHAKHENWQELAEESEMVSKKRQELIDKRELTDFVFEEGKYATEPGEKGKTIGEA